MGSSSEVEYHLLLARDLRFLENAAYGPLSDAVREIKRMLASLISRLRTNGHAREAMSDAVD